MTQQRELEEVVWTPVMSDRRLGERRSAIERRDVLGQTLHVPTPRQPWERRAEKRRQVKTLVITGRAISVEPI